MNNCIVDMELDLFFEDTWNIALEMLSRMMKNIKGIMQQMIKKNWLGH